MNAEADYRSFTFTALPLVGCVNTLPKDKYEMIGTFIECLASMGRQFVTEGYCEVALRTKYAQNEGSYHAIELVRKGIWTEFGYAWTGALNQIDLFTTTTFLGRNNLTSAVESSQPGYQKMLDGVCQNLKKLADAEKAAGY